MPKVFTPLSLNSLPCTITMFNSFSNFNQHGIFNLGQRPSNNNQNPVVCRLCNQVFISIQALITHTESHLAQENLSRGRRSFSPNLINPRRQLIPNPLQPRVTRANSMVTPHTRANPYPYATRVAMSQPIRPRQIPPELMPSTVSYVAEMARLAAPPIYQEEMEVSTIDGTKALIDKLDKPINNNDFTDMIDMNGHNPELNLELSL